MKVRKDDQQSEEAEEVMKLRSPFEILLVLFACLGATVAIVLLGVAFLHGTALDTVRSGKGPFHGFGWILGIPVGIGAIAFLLLLARRAKGS